MASSAKDIQLRELKDTVSQLKTMVSEQTELIRSLRLMIDEKSSHEKSASGTGRLSDQKALWFFQRKKIPMTFRDNRIFLMKRKWNRIHPCWKKKL